MEQRYDVLIPSLEPVDSWDEEVDQAVGEGAELSNNAHWSRSVFCKILVDDILCYEAELQAFAVLLVLAIAIAREGLDVAHNTLSQQDSEKIVGSPVDALQRQYLYFCPTKARTFVLPKQVDLRITSLTTAAYVSIRQHTAAYGG